MRTRRGAIRVLAVLIGFWAGSAPTASDRLSASAVEAGPVVSIGGSVTEIVYALGAEDRVVAVDSTSLYPPPARAKPDVGYMRQLAAEPILALEPALVLAVEDAGPPAVLDQIRESGVPVVTVPDRPTIAGISDKIDVIAEALDLRERGAALNDRLDGEFRVLREAIAETSDRPSVLFLLSTGSGAPMAGGRNTSADGIIALAGGRNVADGFEGYKAFSPEAAVAVAPEVILVTDRTLDQFGGREGLLAMPQIALTPAGQDVRIVSIDGLLLLGFGPRTGEAIRTLFTALHPGRTLPAANDR